MSSNSTIYSKPSAISNPTRRTSINNPTQTSHIGNNVVDENIKSRPSSLSSSEWKQIIMGKLDEFENRLNQDKRIALYKDKYLGHRFPLSYIIASIIAFIVISIIYAFSGTRSLSSIVGVIYPFYMSLKVLNVQNVNDMNKQDNMLWLSYWIWYGIFTTIENISDVVFCWMGNMYEIIKIAIFVYLYHPQTKGALFLYHKILQPLVTQFIHYEHVVLENVDHLKKNITINDPEQFNNMTNISANTSLKNFSGSSSNNLPSKSNIVPPTMLTNQPLSNSSIGANAPLNNMQNTFVPFQPMAFAATTPLNNNGGINPVISAAPINPPVLPFNNSIGASSIGSNMSNNPNGNNMSNNNPNNNNILPNNTNLTSNNLSQ